MLDYIDALIPGVIGLLLVTAPGLFTKARGSTGEQAKEQLRRAGVLALIAAAALAYVEFASH